MAAQALVAQRDARHGCQRPAVSDEPQDRTGVVLRLVHEPALRERRDDQRGDARAGPPAVALRHGGVVVKAAVLVVGDDDQHAPPLRALLQLRDDVGNVGVAVGHVCVAGVLVQVALRFVKTHRGEGAGGRCRQERGVEILQVRGPRARPGGRVERNVIVERLVVRLKLRRAAVDELARLRRAGARGVPRAAVPGP